MAQDDSELLAVVKGFFASLNIQVKDEEEGSKRVEIFTGLMKAAVSIHNEREA